MSEEQAPYFANAGDMIRYIRKQKGITIVDLAKKMGVGQAYIVKIERNEIAPTKEQIEVIKEFINKSTS